MALLELKNLHVALEDGTEIVKGVDLAVNTNETHAIMGPNGSGKSTLAYALMGHPAYEISEGEILLDGEDVTEMAADERAQKGLFLAFQYPHAVPGVTVTSFLRSAINSIRKAKAGEDDPIPIPEFRTELMAAMERLKVPREMASRYLNEGFSGGEKKRIEILQMAMLKPRIAVLDETDSGLDIDALKIVAGGVKELVGPEMGAVVITHYQRILNYIEPDFVHVFVGGRIVKEGGPELADKQAQSWEDLPPDIKNTWDRLGIPEAERKFLAGVGAQYESEVVYHKLQEQLESQGVIFLDMDSGLREHEDIVKQYFGTIIPQNDNKFAALNSAVWSGGSFIYVPPGVSIEMPLQAYFRINAENMGQFDRTLIIVDEGAYVHYVEGCTAPIYSSDSLHSAVVEIIVKKDARCRYTTIQNWSNNVYNLVTKRAVAYEGATMEWVDGNLGSQLTMKYPSVYMVGEHAKGEVLSVAMAGEGQHQDAGAKMVHAAPRTSSTIISKSIARGGGRTSYRGLVQVLEGSHHSRSTVKCDALLVDTISRSDTYPYVDIREDDVSMGHEATVSKVSDDQLFYLMSRGLTEDEAMAMIVRGFIEPIAKELPMEYALELNRLIELQMEGAVG